MIADFELKTELLERFIVAAQKSSDPGAPRVAVCLDKLLRELRKIHDPGFNARVFMPGDHTEARVAMLSMKRATAIFADKCAPEVRSGLVEVLNTMNSIDEDLIRMSINPRAFAREYDTDKQKLSTKPRGAANFDAFQLA